jgi:hypothetical protein
LQQGQGGSGHYPPPQGQGGPQGLQQGQGGSGHYPPPQGQGGPQGLQQGQGGSGHYPPPQGQGGPQGLQQGQGGSGHYPPPQGQGRPQGQGGPQGLQQGQGGQGMQQSAGGANHTSPEQIMQRGNMGSGAGILSFQHAGTVRHCVIRDNTAMKGAGVYNMTAPNRNAVPVYIDDRFENNVALKRGGGMENDMGSHPLVINSQFIGNECQEKGGGMYNDFSSSPIILNTVFSKNRAARAAAFGSDGSSHPVLINVSISGNIADSLGAALYQGSYNTNISKAYNQTTLIQSTLADNRSLTHGPLVFIWGDNRYDFYQSTAIEGEIASSDQIPVKYQALVDWADQLKLKPSTDIQVDYALLKPYWHTMTLGGSKNKGQDTAFVDSDAKLHTTLTVPDQVIFVNVANQAAKQDGLSWQSAYSDLQVAIDKASTLGGAQLWIAKGTYVPQAAKGVAAKEASFQLKSGVMLYGGFNGDEDQRSARDPLKYITRLSGVLSQEGDSQVHSYHVVRGSVNALLDGLTISGGDASGLSYDAYGGGLLMIGAKQATNVKHCIFENNQAYYGGAVYAFNNVMSYFSDDQFVYNEAAMGGALYFSFGSNALIEDSVISNNNAEYRGGGVVVNYGSNPSFKKTIFSHNTTQGVGAGLWVDDQASQFGGTSPSLSQCQFTYNVASFKAGAISVVNKATITLKDTTFSHNLPASNEGV